MKKILYLSSVILVLVSACRDTDQQTDNQPPNIIFILTDDFGYGDVGIIFQNQRAEEGKPHHQTPHLDKMVAEGRLLTRHYVGAPVCAPARASLLQGVHQGHANIRNNQFDKALSDNHNLATVLKEAGYSTAVVGKWGLQGRDGDGPETWEAYPTKRGFDYFFGYPRHRDGHNHYPAHKAAQRPKMKLYRGTEEISDQLKGAYTTDLFTAAAKKWIVGQKETQPEQPFFLYLAYDTPHAGLQVAPSPYPEGEGLNGGVQWIGDEERFINTVDGSIDDYIHPDYSGLDWPEPQKRFASMVRRIDNGVGDLMQLLKDLDIDENTMIVFTSDNGPHRESYGYGNYNPTFFDSFGPLDGIKRDTWEGGIRVPAIVRWPGQITAGTDTDAPSGFHNWLPTFAELAGVPAPARTDGVSLLPALTGESSQNTGTVYIEYSQGGKTPNYAEFAPSHQGQSRGEMQVIYLDGYKGVRQNIRSSDDDFRIYNTFRDPGEKNELRGNNEKYQILQQQMKKKVLRLRRPDSTAARPYDEVPIPAVADPQPSKPGIEYRIYEVSTPWTPDITTLRQSPVEVGVAERIDIGIRSRDNDFVIGYNGLIEVPETGAYRFFLKANRGAVLRIHDATVIDADRGYNPKSTVSSKIPLEKGYHPIQLTYASGGKKAPFLYLQWSGPGVSQQTIDPGRLSHQPNTAKQQITD